MNTIIRLAVMTGVLLLPPAYAVGQEGAAKAPAPSAMVHSIELPHIQVQLKEGQGRIKAETHCAVCHSTDYITMQPKFTRAQWTATVSKMIKTYGAAISEEDANTITGYLAAQYGKEK